MLNDIYFEKMMLISNSSLKSSSKVPTWWDRKEAQLRPATVDIGANRVVRTRDDMIFERKRQSLPFYTYDESKTGGIKQDFNVIDEADLNKKFQTLVPAGRRPPSRDTRDRATIEKDKHQFNTLGINSNFSFKPSDGALFYKSATTRNNQHSSLSKLRSSRHEIEKVERQFKMDKILEQKSLVALQQK